MTPLQAFLLNIVIIVLMLAIELSTSKKQREIKQYIGWIGGFCLYLLFPIFVWMIFYYIKIQ